MGTHTSVHVLTQRTSTKAIVFFSPRRPFELKYVPGYITVMQFKRTQTQKQGSRLLIRVNFVPFKCHATTKDKTFQSTA